MRLAVWMADLCYPHPSAAKAGSTREQTQAFADRLAGEQAKLTEALDLYSQSIVSRLNQASVALAREFRDSSEDLHTRVATAGETAVAAVARQGEATAAA